MTGALLLAIGWNVPAGAADGKGDFAVDGGGAQTCAAFNSARAKRNNDYAIYAGWVDGYVTGANQYTKDTYDMTPWQTSELLLTAIGRYCEKNPQHSFINAVNGMLAALKPERLQQKSELMVIQSEGQGTVAYKAVVEQIQRKLTDKKLYSGKIDGLYSPPLRDALKAFQSKANLEKTGLPDQATLYKLFDN